MSAAADVADERLPMRGDAADVDDQRLSGHGDAAANGAPRLRAVVIGSGFGGLAAAVRLQAAGVATTLLEARDQIGGRAGQIQESGYTFDTGPSLVTAPSLLDDIFRAAGRRLSDYVELVPLDPFYRVWFHDGTHIDYTADTDRMKAGMARFDKRDAERLDAFMERIRPIHAAVIDEGLGARPFDSLAKMAAFAPRVVRLGAWRAVASVVRSTFRDPRHRFLYSFHPLFLGGSPFRAPAIFLMIPYLEKEGGVWYAKGGMHALVKALATVFRELGGELRAGAAATRVEVLQSEARTPASQKEATTAAGNRRRRAVSRPPVRMAPGMPDPHAAGGRRRRAASRRLWRRPFGGPPRPRVTGVRTRDAFLRADIVVSNADAGHTYRTLLAHAPRRRWTDRRIARLHQSMSCFLMYMGAKRKYPRLNHHTIVLGRRYKGLVRDIFDRKVLADDFSVYLHTPSRTDPTMAPPGCESIYALVPVPNAASGIDWRREAEPFARRVVSALEEWGLEGLSEAIEVRHVFTPDDFESEFGALLGNAFGIEPRLTQTAWFRPHNRSEEVDGLYLVGAGTHPGAGVPGVLLSAAATCRAIAEDFGT